MDMKDKTALVTGASRGIGKAISIELAKQGIKHLILVARDRQKLAEVATEIETIGIKVTTLSLDLTQLCSIDIAIAQTWCAHKPIHLLVNCAGVAHQSAFLDTQPHKFKEEISVNLLGMMNITRLFAKRMANQKEGTIVNVSSLMGKVAAPTMSIYSATKFAIVGFTQALRSELAEHNVEVIALLPTLTDTEMARNLKLFRWVMPMTPEKVAQTLILGLQRNRGEILVGWQSYLAVWCQRIFPQLLDRIMILSAPNVSSLAVTRKSRLIANIPAKIIINWLYAQVICYGGEFARLSYGGI